MAMEDDSEDTPRCELDNDGCVRLSCILKAFNAAISEEHAWAVCYQTAKCMQKEWTKNKYGCYCLTSESQVRIHKDGTVHSSTVRDQESGVTRSLATSEYKLVASLGVVIYNTLDYGLCENEERLLSQPLEILIDRMASADPEEASKADDSSSGSGEDAESLQTVDEGIERDAGEDDPEEGCSDGGLSLTTVLEMCASHLPCPEQADSHYKAVCRALVAEVLELSSFLETISKGTQELKTYGPRMEIESASKLDALESPDWARLWMQVIRQLRQGVKLKKVDMHPHPHPIEYELTPYEMLLDDIRSRRYKLNKVMVNGDLPPRVKKDAHALILEFIRCRPPLNPVSHRKLPPPPPRQQSLYEKLMDSIRQPEHKLKPTPFRSKLVETSRTKLQEEDMTPQPRRRLIKADLNLRLSTSFDEDDGDDPPSPSYDSQLTSLPPTNAISARTSPTWSKDPCMSLEEPSDGKPERRHSISVCESPAKPGQKSASDSTSVGGTPNGTLANGHSKTLQNGSAAHEENMAADSFECLSLTLKEIVHVRQVLTEAEVEAIIGDRPLYEEVQKGKVCFTCKKTRFSFFGPWGVKCKICQRTVCDRCSTKMNLPTDPSANIPIYLLTPTPSPPGEEEEEEPPSSSSTFLKFAEAFSFSTPSPKHPDVERLKPQSSRTEPRRQQLQKMHHSESLYALQQSSSAKRRPSTPVLLTTPKRAPLQRAKTIQQHESTTTTPSLRPQMSRQDSASSPHPSVSVCRECKALVRHLIQADQEEAASGSGQQTKDKVSKSWPMRGLGLKACPAMCLSTIVQSPPPNDNSVQNASPFA